METCPHGERIVLELGKPPRVDGCLTCTELLEGHPQVVTENELRPVAA